MPFLQSLKTRAQQKKKLNYKRPSPIKAIKIQTNEQQKIFQNITIDFQNDCQ